MNNETLNEMQTELLNALSKDEMLNKKGLSAIAKLIKSDDARATIRHAIKSSNSDKGQYVEGMKNILSQYSTSAAISMRSLCDEAATNDMSGKSIERNIIPLLIELNIIVKTGERSSHWQAWDKIGCKPGLLDTVLSSFAVTPEKLAAKAEAEKAYAEKLKLDAAKKTEALTLRRKEALMRTVNINKESDILAASLPTQPATLSDKIKANPAAALLGGLLVVGVIASVLTAEPQQALTPLVASVNGSPAIDPRILEGE
ncbi:MAG: hypothetical protein RI964_3245 [Pseudomonadota bacterium]|jgi:hypothetical protein